MEFGMLGLSGKDYFSFIHDQQPKMKMKKHPFMALRTLAVLVAGAVSLNAHAQCNVYMGKPASH